MAGSGTAQAAAIPRGRRLLLALLLLGSLPVAGVEFLRLQIGELAGPAWQLAGLNLQVTLGDDGADLTLDSGALTLEPPFQGLTGATFHCPEMRWEAGGFRCPKGQLQLRGPAVTHTPLPLALSYGAGRWSATLQRVKLAGGHLRGEAHYDPAGWGLTLDAEGVDPSALAPILTALAALPAPFLPGKSVSGHLELTGGGGGVAAVAAKGHMAGLGYSDPSGLYVAEALGLEGQLSARHRAGAWQLQADLRAAAGQGYADPVFLDFAQAPARLQLKGSWEPAARRLKLDQVRLDQGALLQAQGQGTLALAAGAAGTALDLTFASRDLGAGFATYASPFLVGTAADALTVKGGVSGAVTVTGGRLQHARAELTAVEVEDGNGRFGVEDLAGTLAWSRQGGGEPTRLGWAGGHLYAVTLGAAQLEADAGGQGVRLREPLALPVLDGTLRVEAFDLAGIDAGTPALTLEAALQSVSLESLSAALSWPPLSGRLSGVIPSVRYHDGVLEVGGALLVHAFDGELVVRNLRLEDTFGVVPRLGADVDLTGLDLDALTRTFAFGTIQGGLEGYIHGLRLENWAPVAFDAAFRTPPGDDSRHRISQRAVENLTSLGGGVTGALSRGVLRFFEEFSYARLGLSCRLVRGVCRMGGIAEADGGGYVIVKGGGLPRIDVVGYSREVDWEVLVERLKRITASPAPVIQ